MGAFGGHDGRERRWTGLDKLESRNRPPRSLLVALVLASITLITLDVSGGASSAAVNSAACAELSCQSLFANSNAALLSRSSSVGFTSALGTPKPVRLGPIPRATILLFPPRANPAITMSLPVKTNARVLRLASFEGAAVSRS